MSKPLDISAFNIETELTDEDQILDVVVLIRHVNPDCGHDAIYVATSPGSSWVTNLGLVASAKAIMESGFQSVSELDE